MWISEAQALKKRLESSDLCAELSKLHLPDVLNRPDVAFLASRTPLGDRCGGKRTRRLQKITRNHDESCVSHIFSNISNIFSNIFCKVLQNSQDCQEEIERKKEREKESVKSVKSGSQLEGPTSACSCLSSVSLEAESSMSWTPAEPPSIRHRTPFSPSRSRRMHGTSHRFAFGLERSPRLQRDQKRSSFHFFSAFSNGFQWFLVYVYVTYLVYLTYLLTCF